MDKSALKMPKMVNLASFWKPEACGQTVLPDSSILNEQNWWKVPRLEKKSNATFWMNFKHSASSNSPSLQFTLNENFH